jgi:hypothetical protein
MQVSNTVAALIVVLVLLGLYIWNGCKMNLKKYDEKEDFTRTCLTGDSNCKFVRSHVDYVYGDDTDIPMKKGMPFPHAIANLQDKRRPLDQGRIDLIKDEQLLWDPKKLWVQYENDWKGCGDGKPYIVNDDKTRWSLKDVGDVWAARILEAQRTPAHGPEGAFPAIVDLDLAKQDQFQPMYGGSDYLNMMIGR